MGRLFHKKAQTDDFISDHHRWYDKGTIKEAHTMSEILKGNKKFYIGEDESNPIAEITYKDKDANTIIADHTYVSDELRGQGIAGKLFDRLIEFAREENKKIVPLCSYVKVKMERSAEYEDLIGK